MKIDPHIVDMLDEAASKASRELQEYRDYPEGTRIALLEICGTVTELVRVIRESSRPPAPCSCGRTPCPGIHAEVVS